MSILAIRTDHYYRTSNNMFSIFRYIYYSSINGEYVPMKSIKRVHFTSYVLISGVCVWIEPIYIYVILYYLIAYVFAFVERPCAVSGVSYVSGSCHSRIVREVVIAR